MEVGNPVGIAADDLGVDDAWREAAQSRSDHGEAPRDVLARDGAGVMAVELRAPAVVTMMLRRSRGPKAHNIVTVGTCSSSNPS